MGKHHKKQKDLSQSIQSRAFALVEFIDIYGYPLQLRMRKSGTHRTFYGGTITLCIGILTIIYFESQIYNLIYRKVPSMMTSILFNEAPKKEILSLDRFFFAFAMQDRTTFREYKDDSIYTVTMEAKTKELLFNNETKKYEDVYSSRKLDVVNCNYQDHIRIKEVKPYFKKQTMENLFCISKDEWDRSPPIIQGTFDNDLYKYITIKVKPCVNSTDSPTICKPQSVIDQILGAGYFEVFLIDQLADYSRDGSPYTHMGRTIFDSFSIRQTKEYTVYFRQLETISDDGVLFEDDNQYDGLSYSYSQSLNNNFQTFEFLTVVLRLETKREQTNRTFIKLQDVFGIVGGFWSCLTSFGLLLVYPINKLDFELRLVNSLFNFEFHHKDGGKAKKKKDIHHETVESSPNDVSIVTNQKLDKPILNSSVRWNMIASTVKSAIREYILVKDGQEDLIAKEQDLNQNKMKLPTREIKEYLKLKVGKMTLSFQDYLFFYFKCFKYLQIKRNQMKFAMKRMEKELDIVHILRRFTELEKLKILHLTENQLKLFDYLPRPSIPCEKDGTQIKKKYAQELLNTMDKKMKFWTSIHVKKTTTQKAVDAFYAYQRINHNRAEREIEMDEKLMQFLDPRIKDVFEKLLKAERNPLFSKQKTETDDNKDLPQIVQCLSDRGSELNEFTFKQLPYERQNQKAETIYINQNVAHL